MLQSLRIPSKNYSHIPMCVHETVKEQVNKLKLQKKNVKKNNKLDPKYFKSFPEKKRKIIKTPLLCTFIS